MGMRAPKTEIQRILPPLMVIIEELGECKKQPSSMFATLYENKGAGFDPRELRCI